MASHSCQLGQAILSQIANQKQGLVLLVEVDGQKVCFIQVIRFEFVSWSITDQLIEDAVDFIDFPIACRQQQFHDPVDDLKIFQQISEQNRAKSTNPTNRSQACRFHSSK
jgi:hypothetical protein